MFTNYSKIIIPISLLVLILSVAILFRSFRPSPSDNSTANTSTVSQSPPKLLVFTQSGVSGKIVDAVETVIRPRHAAAALRETSDSRFICVLVEATASEKYFQLDHDLSVEQFPFVKKMGFLEPPFQVLRSMSIYRSEAKRVLKFNALTDRLIILICPKSDWAQLNIDCPDLKLTRPAAPPKSSDPAADPNANDHF